MKSEVPSRSFTMNNPPVNGLGHATRSGIFEGLKKALADGAVKVVVITGAGKAFSGGADIKEFNTPKTFAVTESAVGDLGDRGRR